MTPRLVPHAPRLEKPRRRAPSPGAGREAAGAGNGARRRRAGAAGPQLREAARAAATSRRRSRPALPRLRAGGSAASTAALPALSPTSGTRPRRGPSRLSSVCASCRRRRPRRPELPPGLPFSPRPRPLAPPPSPPPRSLFSDHFFLSPNPALNWRLPPSGFASLDCGLSPSGRHQSLQGCVLDATRRHLRRPREAELNCGRRAAAGRLRASPGRASPGPDDCAKAAEDRRFSALRHPCGDLSLTSVPTPQSSRPVHLPLAWSFRLALVPKVTSGYPKGKVAFL